MKSKLASLLILSTLGGCATLSLGTKKPVEPCKDIIQSVAAPTGDFCAIYKPVTTSRTLDSEETKKQIDVNNAYWLEHCKSAS